MCLSVIAIWKLLCHLFPECSPLTIRVILQCLLSWQLSKKRPWTPVAILCTMTILIWSLESPQPILPALRSPKQRVLVSILSGNRKPSSIKASTQCIRHISWPLFANYVILTPVWPSGCGVNSSLGYGQYSVVGSKIILQRKSLHS